MPRIIFLLAHYNVLPPPPHSTRSDQFLHTHGSYFFPCASIFSNSAATPSGTDATVEISSSADLDTCV